VGLQPCAALAVAEELVHVDVVEAALELRQEALYDESEVLEQRGWNVRSRSKTR
jgi:hypothetical protein